MTCCLSSLISLDLVSHVSNSCLESFLSFGTKSLLLPAVWLGSCLIYNKSGNNVNHMFFLYYVFITFLITFLFLAFVWQTPHGLRGSTRWTGGTITLCRLGSRWRRTSRAIGSSRRASTTATCTAPVCRVCARWLNRCVTMFTARESVGKVLHVCRILDRTSD